MTEAMTDLPPGAVLAETWEQCARHVEAGGIVEVRVSWGAWEREWLTPRTYRRRNGAPGGSTWVARRLVPGESAAPYPHTVTPDVPDGYEAVWLPTDVVDEWVGLPTTDYPPSLSQARATIYACREAQARRGTTPASQPTPSPVPPWPGDDDWCGAVLNDLNSIIHQHCGSDGSDDAHCDWVNDLANEVVRYFQRPDVLPAPPPVPSWPDGVLRDAANRLRWIANSGYIEDPGIKRIIRSWADELDATLVPPWPGAVLSDWQCRRGLCGHGWHLPKVEWNAEVHMSPDEARAMAAALAHYANEATP